MHTQEIVKHASSNNISDAEALASSSINGVGFEEFLNGKISTIGENLVARKVAVVNGDVTNAYVHTNGRVGVLLSRTSQYILISLSTYVLGIHLI